MEYKYSTFVDPSTYDDFGLTGGLPLRVSKYDHLANKGCRRAQDDWNQYVGKISVFTGCLCPRFNAMSVSVPECRPERMEMIAYVTEFGFLHDGVWNLAGNMNDNADLHRCNGQLQPREG